MAADESHRSGDRGRGRGGRGCGRDGSRRSNQRRRGGRSAKNGRGQQQQQQQQQPRKNEANRRPTTQQRSGSRKLLILHGNRQTGDLLLARMSSLKRKLARANQPIDLVAPDAPFLFDDSGADDDAPDNGNAQTDHEDGLLRTWWHRHGDEYVGLEQSLDLIRTIWTEGNTFEGILGFSQGARLAHLIALLHTALSTNSNNTSLFPGLKYVIIASGYGDVPLPTNFPPTGPRCDDSPVHSTRNNLSKLRIDLPSLHVMGLTDGLITVGSSRALSSTYVNPAIYEHPGGHHVPMQAAVVDRYLRFIEEACNQQSTQQHNTSEPDTNKDAKNEESKAVAKQPQTPKEPHRDPDEEHAQTQQDECESLALIFPDEFTLHSRTLNDNGEEVSVGRDDMEAGLGEGRQFVHPISYSIKLRPPSDQIIDEAFWPPDENLALRVTYLPNYPDVPPKLTLDHKMNLLEFKSGQEQACMEAIRSAAEVEAGMPCVMGCVYAAREFFEGGGLAASADLQPLATVDGVSSKPEEKLNETDADAKSAVGLLAPASSERIAECSRQGLDIANSLLGHPNTDAEISSWLEGEGDNVAEGAGSSGKGGQWRYTIGLVGKPSAGKSTFFNAATAFARQRGADGTTDADSGLAIGGATMAPHPFTTIHPNIGYCLVPAPPGSCPEEEEDIDKDGMLIGSIHGRDSKGRRLLPVMLKDVAGLVPGAYNGRGKGNKFLDDLTDADVLIHVVDASGTADTEGNALGYSDSEEGTSSKSGAGSHPLDDLNWIRNELLEWVYSNLAAKWDTVSRKGRDRLVGMFSGYRQSQAFVYEVLLEVERYMNRMEGRDHALEHLDSWDAGDLHRLVSAFLGVRFPMALALNKSDLSSAAQYVKDVRGALPIHGAHVGVPLCAKSEMAFVCNSIKRALNSNSGPDMDNKAVAPEGVWSCLQSAIRLREPILVFPVSDMITYAPLSGLNDYASGHSSLPSVGMISCLSSAGGEAPSLWDSERQQYVVSVQSKHTYALRDVLVMKPGSTVEEAFLVLKSIGAVGGEFVRAECAGNIGEKPKLIKKDEQLGKSNRILKIMTNKRSTWQNKESGA